MKKEKTQSDDNSIFKLLIRLARKYPNDSDFGGKIREHIINSNQPA